MIREIDIDRLRDQELNQYLTETEDAEDTELEKADYYWDLEKE